MRIAVWHNLPSGGGKRALYGHIRGLVERGHIVEAWCPPTADQTYLPLTNLCAEHVIPLSTRLPWPWLRKGRVIIDYWEMKERLAAMDEHCRECAAQINRGNFDLLFCNSCVFFRVSPMAKHVQMPSLLYLQEPYRWLYEALPRLPWALPKRGPHVPALKRWVGFAADSLRVQSYRLQMREEIENAASFNTILVNSLYSRESLLRAYGLESKVCYLGIDEQFAPSGEPIESFVVGFGGLSYAKGPDRAIRALGQVSKSKRPELIWVGNFGDKEYERELQQLASRCGVEFTVKTRVSDPELVSLLSRAAMLLYTSRLEPFGLAPLEANACGTPVVAIAEGGVRETVQHEMNGLLVNGDHPEGLAEAIERLIDNREFADAMRERALRYARNNFQMRDAVDQLELALLALKEANSPDGEGRPQSARVEANLVA